MHPDHLVRSLRAPGDLGDRDRARVAGQNGVGARQAVELAEEPELELGVLRRGLHDERAIARGVERRVGGDARERGIACGAVERPLLHLPRQVLLDRRASLRQRVRRDVDHRHVEPALREDVRDPVPHLPGADHRHPLGHACTSMLRRRNHQRRAT